MVALVQVFFAIAGCLPSPSFFSVSRIQSDREQGEHQRHSQVWGRKRVEIERETRAWCCRPQLGQPVGAHLFGQQPEQGGIGTIDLLPQVFPVRTQDIASEPSFNAAKLGLGPGDHDCPA